MTLTACGAASQSSSAGQNPDIRIGYFTGGVVAPENIIHADPGLRNSVHAQMKMIPITAGLAALSAMRGGAFDIVSSVGNPPVVSALVAHTPLRVVWIESYDGASLIVNPKIKSNADLKGKTIGDLQGSSEDFELRGWLKANGLSNQVKVVGFPSDAAAGAAWRSGKIDGAYVMVDVAVGLKAHGGRQVVTAAQIAKLGYPSLNVTAASTQLIQEHPKTVQQFVCAEAAAQRLLTTGDAATRKKYIAASAKEVGAPTDLALKSTAEWPNMPVDQVSHWLGGSAKTVSASSPIVKAYVLTGNFLKRSGSVPDIPSTSQLQAAVDPQFASVALSGGCKNG